MTAPLLSVIVFCDPQHDNTGTAYVSCVLAQTLPFADFELIIADDSGRHVFRDEAMAAAAQNPALQFRYLPVSRRGRAATVNEGIANARGEVIAIFADDALPTPGAFAAHLRFHQINPDPFAVSIGPTPFRDPLRNDLLRRWLEDSGSLFGVPVRRQPTHWPRDFFFSGNCAMKRSLIRHIGGFDERFPWITWDDYEFGLRLVAAGGYSQLVSGGLAWHEHYVTLEERAGAMRKGGHAARLHETFGAVARPWQTRLDSAARQRHLPLCGDDPQLSAIERVTHFQRHFDRAFLEGYEAESRGDRSDLVGLVGTT